MSLVSSCKEGAVAIHYLIQAENVSRHLLFLSFSFLDVKMKGDELLVLFELMNFQKGVGSSRFFTFNFGSM